GCLSGLSDTLPLISLLSRCTEFFQKSNRSPIVSAGGAVSAKDATGALADLKNLFDSGVITAEEYEEKRQNLLKSL
ncbi:MAG: SHOCT domain-containing protein, partial [Nostoc sp.]